MYTQCPECSTVFRVTADALRVAQGSVRCGICSASFNALDSLREEAARALEDVPPEDTITVEELPNENIELSSPEAEASGEPVAEAGPGGSEPQGTAPAEAAEDAAAAEPAEAAPELLEFRGSAEDLERVFVLVESPPHVAAAQPWAAATDEPDRLQQAMEQAAMADLSGIEVEEAAAYDERGSALDDLEATDEFPILVLEEQDAAADAALSPPEPAPRQPAAAGARAAPQAAEDEAGPRFLIPPELRRDLGSAAPVAADGLRLESRDALGLPPEEPEEESPRRWPWVAAAAVLLAGLGAQAAHFWRDDLVQSPVAGPWMLRAYDALGLSLDPPTDLSAFELRQWGATSDASHPDRLKLRASIVNRAAFAQPYPLLRLSLQDRFGNTIGARDVAAADYLPGAGTATPRLLAPGQRADAEIVFVDPGRDAVGFELDLCVPAGDGLRCANPAAAP